MRRRDFNVLAGGALASLAFGGCSTRVAGPAAAGRLSARPRKDVTPPPAAAGAHPLGIGRSRDGIIQVPKRASGALPLLVLLHGAGGDASGLVEWLGEFADEAGLAILAPDSRGSTWDAIGGGFGTDVEFLDRALAHVFAATAIDPERIAIGGFSDGATYALSLGLINGDLFRRVVAFSPGFVVHGPAQGKPRIFVSHGTSDAILPIARCSRAIVPALRSAGYDVTFREFDGGHTVPEETAREAMRLAAAR
jgi:phospholipase/carboxylesterase